MSVPGAFFLRLRLFQQAESIFWQIHEPNEDWINSQCKAFFGFDGFKGNQEAIINNILNKQDTFVIMPTGGGKSLCYQIPAICRAGCGIVVSPLIALMADQVRALEVAGVCRRQSLRDGYPGWA